MLQACGLSDKGRIRPTNEDYFWIDEPLGLCIVADGMGGHNAGEVAARMAVDMVVDYVRSQAPVADQGSPFGCDPVLSPAGNLLRTAIQLANVRILEAALSEHVYSGMGTTVVAALVQDGTLAIAHVGDSRLYLFSPPRLRLLTRDDSWVASLLATDPSADPAVLRHHPMRNALTNVVGAHACTQVHVVEEALHGGEAIVLTTDGVHGVVDDRRLERLLSEDRPVGATAERLMAAALGEGSLDNCTAVVAKYRAS